MRSNYRILPDFIQANFLSDAARMVLGALIAHRNDLTRQCNPRHTTLARELGWNYWKVQRSIRELREAGCINPRKTQRGNWYEITPRDQWHRPCRPVADPDVAKPGCVGVSALAPMPRQNPPFLIEQAASSSERRTVAAAERSVTTRDGGGGGFPVEDKTQANAPDLSVLLLAVVATLAAHLKASTGGSSPSEPAAAKPVPVPPPPPPAPPRPPIPPYPSDAAAENKKIPENNNSRELSEAQALAEELMERHPMPGNLPRAVPAAAKLLARNVKPDTLRANHKLWCRLWGTYQPGRFIPQLWRWLEDGDWRSTPQKLGPTKDEVAARDAARLEKARQEAEEKAAELKRRQDECVARLKKSGQHDEIMRRLGRCQ